MGKISREERREAYCKVAGQLRGMQTREMIEEFSCAVVFCDYK